MADKKPEQILSQYLDFFFQSIGENPQREGLKETSRRLIESNAFLYSGYAKNPNDILDSLFSEGACDEMVIVKHIEFYSMCEHHFLPFFGEISIGYIPDKKVVGLSNISELVEVFARRLQIQENLTTQIADTIMQVLKPKGTMVVCEALHLCMAMRGVEKQKARVITSAVRGLFKKDSRTRMEFMQLIK
ncbi:GTP cyclohydrolase I FolE [Helicobacter aurati]|uniref:GTP cyclohydrolase 1 n=1 Tax=Helicobacter aurati TaxID=137778 RepID=A0A3D8J938_9HELI|nr:GTP cyclohydrolase I FolE [Helicobacter aurati]RDU73800.1 GTP cyclohydrolase I FolE [Helicobacter aurati]